MLEQQISDVAAAAAAAAVGVAAAEGGGSGPPAWTEAIGAGCSCGKIVRVYSWYVWLMGWLAHGIQKEETGKKMYQVAHMRSHFSMVQHIGRPVARPVKSTGRPRSTGRPTKMAGQPE